MEMKDKFMSVKEIIKKNTVEKNIYCLDLIYKIRNRDRNNRVESLLRSVQGIDSILEFDKFKEAVIPYLKKDFLSYSHYGNESMHYGHLNSLYDYAEIQEPVNTKVLPCMEHGITLTMRRCREDEELRIFHNFVYQSKYKMDKIHKRNPWKPVFCIGPYIHYAQKYYDEEKESVLKKKLGKVLTVFLMHGLETYDNHYDNTFLVDYIMDYAKDKFDTVMVCVYWGDVQIPIYQHFKERGAMLVSAGYREDCNFMRRQKTILSLTDQVICNGVGAFTGYSYYMKKPLVMMDFRVEALQGEEGKERLVDFDEESKEYDLFIEAFSSVTPTDEQREKQRELIEFYWGTQNRSKGEIRDLLSLSKKILTRSKYTFDRFDEVVQYYYEYGLMKNELSNGEYRLLKEALNK